MPPSNEYRRKVKPSDSMINSILDSNQQLSQSVEGMQAGFDDLIAVNKQVADTLDVIMQSMETFAHSGGTVSDDGRIGGSVMFTQLVETSVSGIVDGIKEALGVYFDDESKAIRAVGNTVVANAQDIERGRMMRERSRVSRNMSSMKGEPSIYADIRQYLRTSDRMLAMATSERYRDEDGNEVKRTVADIRDNLVEMGSANAEMRNELEQEMLSMESLLDHEAQEQQYIHEQLESAAEEGSELTREQIRTMQEELAESERTSEYYQKLLDTGHDLIDSVESAGDNIESAVRSTEAFDEGGIASLLDELMNGRSKIIRSGGVTRSLEDASGTLDGLADVLGKSQKLSELSNVVRGISASVTRIAPWIFAIETGVGAIGDTNQKIRELNDRAVEIYGSTRSIVESIGLDIKLGTQSQMAAFMSGLDAKETQQMQNELISLGIDPESERFDEGFDFAISARREYGINARRSAELFEKFVVEGGRSINELNNTMRSLSDVVEGSRETMSEAVDKFQKNIEKLESATGSDELAADLQDEIAKMFSGNQGMQDMATTIVADAERSEDYRYQELRQEYVDAGYDYESAAIRAAFDYEKDYGSKASYGSDRYKLFHAPVNEQGDTLMDVILSGGDVGETLSALAAGDAGGAYGVGGAYWGAGGDAAVHEIMEAARSLGIDESTLEGENALERSVYLFGGMQSGFASSNERYQSIMNSGLGASGSGTRYDASVHSAHAPGMSTSDYIGWIGDSLSGNVDATESVANIEESRMARLAADTLYDINPIDSLAEGSIPLVSWAARLANVTGVNYHKRDDGRSRDYSLDEISMMLGYLADNNMMTDNMLEQINQLDEAGLQSFMEDMLSAYVQDSGAVDAMNQDWFSLLTDKSEYNRNMDKYSFSRWAQNVSYDEIASALESARQESGGSDVEIANISGVLRLEDRDGVIVGVMEASNNEKSLNSDATPVTSGR